MITITKHKQENETMTRLYFWALCASATLFLLTLEQSFGAVEAQITSHHYTGATWRPISPVPVWPHQHRPLTVRLYDTNEVNNLVAQVTAKIGANTTADNAFKQTITTNLDNTKKELKTFVIFENRKVIHAVKQAPLNILKEDVMKEMEERITEHLIEHFKELKENEELFDDDDK